CGSGPDRRPADSPARVCCLRVLRVIARRPRLACWVVALGSPFQAAVRCTDWTHTDLEAALVDCRWYGARRACDAACIRCAGAAERGRLPLGARRIWRVRWWSSDRAGSDDQLACANTVVTTQHRLHIRSAAVGCALPADTCARVAHLAWPLGIS